MVSDVIQSQKPPFPARKNNLPNNPIHLSDIALIQCPTPEIQYPSLEFAIHKPGKDCPAFSNGCQVMKDRLV